MNKNISKLIEEFKQLSSKEQKNVINLLIKESASKKKVWWCIKEYVKIPIVKNHFLQISKTSNTVVKNVVSTTKDAKE